MSGGTVALVTGVYDVLLGSLAHLARATRVAVVDGVRGRGLGAAREHAAQVPWRHVVPLGFGMLGGVIAGALMLGPLLDERPGDVRAVLAGLVLGAVAAPLRMMRRDVRSRHVVMGAAAGLAAFVLTGIPPADAVEPPLPLVALAVSVAVCALVLPGVSAAFLLLTVGLYDPTLDAVNDADVGYLAAAVAGGLVGLGVWGVLLQRLLSRARTATLAVLAGLMLGSLRALWPWQGPDRQLQPPQDDVVPRALLAVAGVLVVVGLLALDQRRQPREDRGKRSSAGTGGASAVERREGD